ncbi:MULTISPECIES: hypothetical protein [unclassified Clostridium]|uniref:hypothetical protein n=1 Tax=unclassified Clostridium TaxID=2614128 RepID=UPI00290F42AD|nr:hypothetical protein [Clostridium sp.]MDU5107145.1 hypothetical protein [Clostridium sp.]
MEMIITAKEGLKKNTSLVNKCYLGYLKNRIKKENKFEDKDEIEKYIKAKWGSK